MTTPIPATPFAGPAPAHRLERAAAALTAHGFTVEILDDAAAARTRIRDLIPEGASVFTGASETLRLSGIEEDINSSGRYDAVKSRSRAMDRVVELDEIWRLMSTPDVIVGSVHAVTETGSLVVASASGSQLPGYAGAAARAIWIVGAQKVVPDLPAALRRVEDHALPLESARTQVVYGQPSAINRLLILNAEPHPGRGTVLLLREAIGFLSRPALALIQLKEFELSRTTWVSRSLPPLTPHLNPQVTALAPAQDHVIVDIYPPFSAGSNPR